MNKSINRSLVSILILLSSCSKEFVSMEVVRDCSGTYLKNKSGAESYVCNKDKINQFSTGDMIDVKVEIVEECYGILEEPTCLLYHPFENRIEVKAIKD